MDFSPFLNVDYLESRYALWKEDPESVPPEWRIFFQGFELGSPSGETVRGGLDRDSALKLVGVHDLVARYREIGHLLSCVDPLSQCATEHPLLAPEAFGLTEADFDKRFPAPAPLLGGDATLREIIRALRETYCRSIGVEYMHVQDPGERRWLQDRMEPGRNRPDLTGAERRNILRKLMEANAFEQFLHRVYVGQKRFSVEGAEALVAGLDAVFRYAGALGAREIVLGMSHRGRLSVQTGVLGKPFETVFCEFEDNYDPESLVGSGDVKYHRGYLGTLALEGGRELRALLVTNPSHLEAVDPVVEGIARARQDATGDPGVKSVVPFLVHGDAAFSGQGVVSETLNLSQLEGYRTGGTVHVIVNNQIGFTTLPEDARSTRYTTDVAKMLMVPVFHVHGEDPEAVVHVLKLALDYRNAFAKDVVVDLIGYRRYGHNEGDEPYYTQPEMYRRIKERLPVHKLYAERLADSGLADAGTAREMEKSIVGALEKAHDSARAKACLEPFPEFLTGWEGLSGKGEAAMLAPVETGVETDRLKALVRGVTAVPEGFHLHPRLEKILARRVETVEQGSEIDWATAELLSFATLLTEGVPVRVSGEDVRRGTFSQRHSVFSDAETGAHHSPLEHLAPDQAPFRIYDSALSENAVLGFEVGYSWADPHGLVVWEAQFGDFANNAQVIIDQFIVGAEAKWGRPGGLVLLLPHGIEGQGPEHSSARPERYLQLCAQGNIQVCTPSTPAQMFHLLRRQMKRPFRKPLVVMTPKSLLRNPLAVSSLSEMTSGGYREVLDDPAEVKGAKRVLLCAGKVFYDLLAARNERPDEGSGTAIVRIEQFYPFPEERLREVATRYADAPEWVWVQEEPRNMGAWEFLRSRLKKALGRDIRYLGRPASPVASSGHLSIYREEQAALVSAALGRS